MTRAGLVFALSITGCASVPPAATTVIGNWGGPHIGLALDEMGGRLEYDCAAGTIGPVVAGEGGSFTGSGTHTPASGGPDIVGQVRPTYSARFSGIVRGDRMTFQARVENGVVLGPFSLKRGDEPGTFRCL